MKVPLYFPWKWRLGRLGWTRWDDTAEEISGKYPGGITVRAGAVFSSAFTGGPSDIRV
jgi:hypothetical protein